MRMHLWFVLRLLLVVIGWGSCRGLHLRSIGAFCSIDVHMHAPRLSVCRGLLHRAFSILSALSKACMCRSMRLACRHGPHVPCARASM